VARGSAFIIDAEAGIRSAVREASRHAFASGRPVLGSVTVPTSAAAGPLDLVTWAGARSLNPALFSRPADGFSLVGVGRAWEIAAAGEDRFHAARQAWDALRGSAVEHPPSVRAWGTGPVLAGGFAFAPEGSSGREWGAFGASSLVLPRVTALFARHKLWLTLSVVVNPGPTAEAGAEAGIAEGLAMLAGIDGLTASPTAAGADDHAPGSVTKQELVPASEWMALVEAAARAVREGELTKVVMARAISATAHEFDPTVTLRRLMESYPTCTTFAVVRGDRWFLGATPERLARVEDGSVTAMALAGSAPRGATEDQDRRLGEALLASRKDRIEHAVVVDMLREALEELCEPVSVAAAPSLFRVSNVQHLHTPISGRLRPGRTILDLAGRLHPTPAVGGVPRKAALEWLSRHERLDRGWYAGAVGWVDRWGGGDFAVAIRSALLWDGQALLFGGCGIVADSDPEAEYAESRLKLRPMLSALGANGEP
jgi:isochorismate synthase